MDGSETTPELTTPDGEGPTASPIAAFSLPPRCDLAAAADLRNALLAVVGTERLTLDAASVTRCDTPVIQILLAAAGEQAARGLGFSVLRPSADLRRALDDVGLGSKLDAWEISNG